MKNIQLNFQKIDGTPILDVLSYVKEWINKHPYGDITIGCDSQPHGKKVRYAITICMHDIDKYGGGHGAHVIHAIHYDSHTSLKKDLYTKLWAEAELTITAGEMIKDCGKTINIHLDFNSKETEYSNVLYASGIGYVASLGYKAYGKPHAWASTHAADKLAKE
jgi:predicted RNase H-related nuclease YkuK (DUF458 family)